MGKSPLFQLGPANMYSSVSMAIAGKLVFFPVQATRARVLALPFSLHVQTCAYRPVRTDSHVRTDPCAQTHTYRVARTDPYVHRFVCTDSSYRLVRTRLYVQTRGGLEQVEKSGHPKTANPATKPCMENAILGQLAPRTSLEAAVHTYS